MPGIDIYHETFQIAESEIAVSWQAYDFTDEVSGIPDEHIRAVMLDSGVMYVAEAEPKIRVSNLLDLDLQGPSAAHEELCMAQNLDECSAVERMVIDSITDPDLQSSFIRTRLRMFGALCMLDSSNRDFAATRQVLADSADLG